MSYNDTIIRDSANALIPEEQSKKIIQGIVEESTILKLATRLPDMSSKTLRMPVLSSLPHAYFVDGDTGLKQTTNASWDNVYITAEEIAVIVPVADAILADAEYDIWAQIRPLVAQAFGKKIDDAILNGGVGSRPESWHDGIINMAYNYYDSFVEMSSNGFNDIMGENGLIALVEKNGSLVNGFVGSYNSRSYLRGITDKNGQPIFRNGMADGTPYMLDGQPIVFPKNGSMPVHLRDRTAHLVAGDWSQLVYAIRQDMTVTKTNTGVITDSDGKVIYNLYQQDMTALRFVMRLGWTLPQYASAMRGEEQENFPFSILVTPSSD